MSSATTPAISESGFLAAGIVLSIFTAAMVSVRLVAGVHTAGKYHADDYLSVIATVFLAANFSMFFVLIQASKQLAFPTELDPRPIIRRVAQYAEAEIFLSGFSMWTAKLPVLVLLIRIFGVNRGVRVVSIITIVVLGLAIIAGDIYNAIICKPPSIDDQLPVYLDTVTKCTDASSLTGSILAPIGLAADIIIFILPLPVIFKLNLSLEKRIGLMVVFLFGLVAIAVTAVSTKFKIDSRSGKSTDVELAMVLTLIETTIVIAAGCVPAVKVFWAAFIVKSGWYSKLTSLLSTSRRNTAGSRSKQSQGSQETDQYYQLEEQQNSTRKLTAEPHVRGVDHPQTWR